MKCQSIAAFWVHASMAFDVNSVPWSETISLGLPRRAMTVASSRATRTPEIEVSTTAAKRARGAHGEGAVRAVDHLAAGPADRLERLRRPPAP